jgi:hypothetical protein
MPNVGELRSGEKCQSVKPAYTKDEHLAAPAGQAEKRCHSEVTKAGS